jgi:hypothetical protein
MKLILSRICVFGQFRPTLCQKSVEGLFVDSPFMLKEFNLFVVNALRMKCYRIRDQNRISFIMVSQLERIEKSYSVERKRLTVDFQMIDEVKQGLELLMDEEAYSLFEMRWERFQTSDEIFFDFAEFQ